MSSASSSAAARRRRQSTRLVAMLLVFGLVITLVAAVGLGGESSPEDATELAIRDFLQRTGDPELIDRDPNDPAIRAYFDHGLQPLVGDADGAFRITADTAEPTEVAADEFAWGTVVSGWTVTGMYDPQRFTYEPTGEVFGPTGGTPAAVVFAALPRSADAAVQVFGVFSRTEDSVWNAVPVTQQVFEDGYELQLSVPTLEADVEIAVVEHTGNIIFDLADDPGAITVNFKNPADLSDPDFGRIVRLRPPDTDETADPTTSAVASTNCNQPDDFLDVQIQPINDAGDGPDNINALQFGITGVRTAVNWPCE